MTKTNPQVSNASLQLTVLPSTVSPVQNQLPIDLPLTFTNAANVQVFTGTYTPSNDQLAPWTNPNSTSSAFSNALSPTWLLLIVDGTVNLTVASQSTTNFCTDLPVSRVLFMSLSTTAANYATKILFDGQTSVTVPMTQATPVNYTLIIGQGTVS